MTSDLFSDMKVHPLTASCGPMDSKVSPREGTSFCLSSKHRGLGSPSPITCLLSCLSFYDGKYKQKVDIGGKLLREGFITLLG